MKRLLLPVVALALVGILFPTGVRHAYACTCAGPSSAEEKVAEADVVAIGTISRIFDNPYTMPDARSVTGEITVADVDAVVLVERYLKGTGPQEITVDDPSPHGGCGIFDRYSADSRYLLFLRGETSPFTTGLCSGSHRLAGIYSPAEGRSAEKLRSVQAITGPGTLPQEPTTLDRPQTDDSAPWLPIILGSSLAATAVAAASAVLLRRRLTRG